MANTFAITISAIDRATATVRKINNSFSQLTRPINQVGQSTKALGRELGMDKMAKSIANVANNAKDAAAQVGKIGAPMLALVGGGSLVGIAALATQWARLGSEISRTSRTIGVSAGDLQSLRGASQVLGVSSSELTGGMKALGDTMQDALYGRNQDALAVLNKLGIGIHKTSSGAIDSTRAFRDLSVAISNIKSPQVQGLVARTFGVEALLPILREGPAAIAKYQEKVRQLGGVMGPESIRRAESFGMALNYLSIAGQGLRNTIGDSLIPAFQPLVEDLTRLISVNRVLIGQKVGEWAEDIAKWVKSIRWNEVWSGIERTVKGIAGFVDAIGGWKVAAIGVGAVMAGPLLLSITGITIGVASLLLKVPLLIAGLNGIGAASATASASGMGLLGTLGKLGAAGVGAYAALQVAKAAGLPDTDRDKGMKSVKDGRWFAASAQLPAADFLGAVWNRIAHSANASSSGQYAPLLNLIGKAEGTDKGRGYNETLGYGAYTGGEQNLTGMSLKEIDALQTKMLANPNNRLNSSAVGRYQFTRTTLRDLTRRNNLTGDEKFDPAMQDRLAGDLIKNLPAGSAAQLQNGLAGVWASFPRANTGMSAYGQRTGTDTESVRTAIAQSLRPDGAAASTTKVASTDGKQQLQIHLSGLPQGTKATARDSEGKSVPVNVATNSGVGP